MSDEIKCPKCGQQRQPDSTECQNCGIIFSKYEIAMKRKPKENVLIKKKIKQKVKKEKKLRDKVDLKAKKDQKKKEIRLRRQIKIDAIIEKSKLVIQKLFLSFKKGTSKASPLQLTAIFLILIILSVSLVYNILKQPDYEGSIQAWMEQSLKDPDSVKGLEIHKPSKSVLGYNLFGLKAGEKVYVVPVIYNAKNSYGGYTGSKVHFFYFKGGKIVGILD